MRLDGLEEETVRGHVRAPELCRLTILAQRTQVDLAVPLNVPLALLIPGIVDMVSTHVHNNEFDSGAESVQPREWVLARVGRPPLSGSLSLGEQGVRDGELLMLESADHTAPPPLFDDIMHNVAIADASRYRRWSPRVARLIGSVFAAVSILAGCFGLLWHGVGQTDVIGAVTAIFVALVLLIAGIVVSRMYADGGSGLVLCGSALPVAFTAGVLAVPGEWSWSQVLVGAAMAGALAALALRVAGVGLPLFTAAALMSLFLVPAALVGMFVDTELRVISSIAAAAALGALAMAPRLSMLLSQLPLPPVPTMGTKIDPSEDDPSDRQTMPGFAELEEKARRAHKYLAGLVAGSTVLAVGGALAAAAPYHTGGGVYWPGTALAIVVAVVLMFRGRTYANAEEAVTLFAGGAFLAVSLLIGAGIATKWSVAVFAAALIIALTALAIGAIAPRHTATPPMRRAVELLEYAFIASVVPLVCAVADLYTAVRGL